MNNTLFKKKTRNNNLKDVTCLLITVGRIRGEDDDVSRCTSNRVPKRRYALRGLVGVMITVNVGLEGMRLPLIKIHMVIKVETTDQKKSNKLREL